MKKYILFLILTFNAMQYLLPSHQDVGYLRAQENTGQEEEEEEDDEEEDDYNDIYENDWTSEEYDDQQEFMEGQYDGDVMVSDNGDMQIWIEDTGSWMIVADIEITPENDDMFANITDFSTGDNVMAGAFVLSGGLLADDATVIGIVDDVLIPVVLTTGLVVASYLWWQAYDASSVEEAVRQECIDTYADLCRGAYGYKNMDCSICLQFCIAQGEWDSDNCPLTD